MTKYKRDVKVHNLHSFVYFFVVGNPLNPKGKEKKKKNWQEVSRNKRKTFKVSRHWRLKRVVYKRVFWLQSFDFKLYLQ